MSGYEIWKESGKIGRMKSNLESTHTPATRTGKIARLPQAIRQQRQGERGERSIRAG